MPIIQIQLKPFYDKKLSTYGKSKSLSKSDVSIEILEEFLDGKLVYKNEE
jgi:hypothetical protein